MLHSGIPITRVLLDAINTIPMTEKLFKEFSRRQDIVEAQHCFSTLKMVRDTDFDERIHSEYFMWDSCPAGVTVLIRRRDQTIDGNTTVHFDLLPALERHTYRRSYSHLPQRLLLFLARRRVVHKRPRIYNHRGQRPNGSIIDAHYQEIRVGPRLLLEMDRERRSRIVAKNYHHATTEFLHVATAPPQSTNDGKLHNLLMCRFRASLKHKYNGQTKFLKPNSQKQDIIIKYWVSIVSIHREQG